MAEGQPFTPDMQVCEPCKFRGDTPFTTAVKFCLLCQEPLCVTCADVHGSSKATRAHLQVNITEKETNTVIGQDLNTFQMCKDHPGKELEYFCSERGKFYCSTCLFLCPGQFDVRNLCDISTAGKNLVTKKFSETIFLDLDNAIETCKTEEFKIIGWKDACVQNRTNIHKQLDETRQQLLATFNKYEKQVLDKVEKDERVHNALLDTELEKIIELRQTFENNKAFYQTIAENGSAENIFRCSFSIIRQVDEAKKMPLRQATTHINHTLNLSATLYSFITECVPAMTCGTRNTLQEPVNFPTFSTSKEQFIDTIKHSAVQSDNSKTKEYMLASADADAKEEINLCNRTCDNSTDCNETRNICNIDGNSHVQILCENTHEASTELEEIKIRTETLKENTESDMLINHLSVTSVNDEQGSCNEESTNATQTSVTCVVKPMATDGRLQFIHSSNESIPIKEKCCIQGLAFTFDGHLVVTDSNESQLILINQDFTLVSSIKLTAIPGRIAVLDEKSLAICMPKSYRVAICHIKPKLKWIRYFITTRQPIDINPVNSNKLLVSLINDDKQWVLRILSTEGKTLSTIARNRSFLDASFVALQRTEVTKGLLYLQCCKRSQTIYCFDEDGKDIFQHAVGVPSALCKDTNDNVYIIDSAGTLRVISRVGQLILMTQTGIRDAICIGYDAVLKRVIVVKKQSKIVSIFDVKAKKKESIV